MRNFLLFFILEKVSSFSCYTHENNGTSSSSEECDTDIGHCYIKKSYNGEFKRECANEDAIKYFEKYNITTKDCIVCNQADGCPYEGDEAFTLEDGDVHCLCDTNFCNGICKGRSEEGCSAMIILEQEVEKCNFYCETTWMECGALIHNTGYFWLVQAVIWVFMTGMTNNFRLGT